MFMRFIFSFFFWKKEDRFVFAFERIRR